MRNGLDKTTMSANQLARKANALRKELRDTVKSLQPEKYAALEKELKEVEKAYGQATKKAEGFGGSLLSLNKNKTVLAGVFVTIGAMITGQIVGGLKGCDQYYYRVREEKQYVGRYPGNYEKKYQGFNG